jgi:hypothetical protein
MEGGHTYEQKKKACTWPQAHAGKHSITSFFSPQTVSRSRESFLDGRISLRYVEAVF